MYFARLTTACVLIAASLYSLPGLCDQTLTLVSYNVKGLPPLILKGDGPKRMTMIAGHLRGYDVALLQEVFAYRELISAKAEPVDWFNGPSRRFRWRQLPALLLLFAPCRLTKFCEMPGSAGLATAVFNSDIQTYVLHTERFESCHGVMKYANDCLAAKGFQVISLGLDGKTVHVYNTHLDAGRHSRDRFARQRQLDQIVESISTLSNEAAVIVAGDLNLRRDSSDDQLILTSMLSETGLKNSGAFESPACEFGCKGLDYILYRSGETARIKVSDTSASEALEFRQDGTPLSDHPPLFVSFSIQ